MPRQECKQTQCKVVLSFYDCCSVNPLETRHKGELLKWSSIRNSGSGFLGNNANAATRNVRAVNAYSHMCVVSVCVGVCERVCVVQFASNKPFTMRARSVNATLYSPGLVCVSLLCVCVCCVLCAVRCLLLGVAVTQPLTTIPYPVFRCHCLCLCLRYFQSRSIPVARASWLCQL